MADLTGAQGSTPVEIIEEASGNTVIVNTDGYINTTVKRYGPSSAYVRISTNTTTVVKSGAGFLRRIIKSQGGSVTIYDDTSASGTVIHTLGGTNPQGTIEYDIPFTTGLTIVTTSGPDLVVVYD